MEPLTNTDSRASVSNANEDAAFHSRNAGEAEAGLSNTLQPNLRS